ncbi:hypothetical protein D3H64_06020 [Atopobacter sp. AH10]|uniref:phage tail spike protein n=1 Tax=Atopobacter sp. AH10 TaxID=2315861 RepID=UPI000EF285B6|nr:phage tail spike protein [Atopobacter sp. AH10]RLK63148.1 hypothetical protein D3H64_06020 [Atopobacter sp. AH10]
MKPILFKADEAKFDTYGLGEINATKAIATRERNGNYTLYLEYPAQGEMANLFQREMKIKADAGVRTKNQTFEISRINKSSDKLIKIYAKHISHKTEQMALAPSVAITKSGADVALAMWADNLVGGVKFNTWSDITTENSTKWTVDKIANAREALGGVSGSILDTWGGEYEFDNTTIKLHSQLGRKVPTVLEYGRNILSAEEDEDIENTYTSIYPFASYTPQVEDGKSGMPDPIIVTLPERYIDGKYIKAYAHRRVQIVDLSSKFGENEKPTEEKLRKYTESYLKNNRVGLPKINVKVKYIDLSTTLDYQDLKVVEEIELCDIVPIYYPSLGIIDAEAKVTQVEYNVLLDRNESIEVGTIGSGIKSAMGGILSDQLNDLENKQDKINQVVIPSLINSRGNRIWYGKPPDDIEHKIGDVQFEKNGNYDRLYIWNGKNWIKVLDTESLDNIAQQKIEESEKRTNKMKQALEQRQSRNEAQLNSFKQSLTETDQELKTLVTNAKGDINRLRQRADGFDSSISNLGRSMSSSITQLQNQIDLRVTRGDVRSIINSSGDSIYLALKNKLPDGKMSGREIKNAIAIDKSGILIDGQHLSITADTHINNGVIKNAHIGDLSASKITAGTLNAADVRIINLDVNNLTGNMAQFIQTLFNGKNSKVKIDPSGMQVMTNSGSYSSKFTENGIEIWRSGTHVGSVHSLDATDKSGPYAGMKSMSLTTQPDSYLSLSYYSLANKTFYRALSLGGDGRLRLHSPFNIGDSNRGWSFETGTFPRASSDGRQYATMIKDTYTGRAFGISEDGDFWMPINSGEIVSSTMLWNKYLDLSRQISYLKSEIRTISNKSNSWSGGGYTPSPEPEPYRPTPNPTPNYSETISVGDRVKFKSSATYYYNNDDQAVRIPTYSSSGQPIKNGTFTVARIRPWSHQRYGYYELYIGRWQIAWAAKDDVYKV